MRTRVNIVESPHSVTLPEVLMNPNSCEKCYANRECLMYAASAHFFQPASVAATHSELLNRFTGHLSDADFRYFEMWDRLVDLEADAEYSNPAESWLIRSSELERTTSKSLSAMRFDPQGCSTAETLGEASSQVISFLRTMHSSQQRLDNLGLEKGCHVIVSTDTTTTANSPTLLGRKHMHIVRGFMEGASSTRIFIRCGRDDHQRLRKMIAKTSPDLLFRLDRDEIATGVGTLRQNLINLLTADRSDSERVKKSEKLRQRLPQLRSLVIGLCPPSFDDRLLKTMFTDFGARQALLVPGCDLFDLSMEYSELNDDQRAAVDKVMTARDYTLIQGLPGTGKTTTIAFIVRLLAAQGKRVLISSYTNAAVDNVLLKLLENGMGATDSSSPSPALIRIGRVSSCHPGVHGIHVTAAAKGLDGTDNDPPTAESIGRALHCARVIGATALSIPRAPLLVDQQFDVVLVDEAGQISQPAIIGSLMAADSFVLVGDHMQLPPLATSELAEMGGTVFSSHSGKLYNLSLLSAGFTVSLLKRLAEAHPQGIVQLTYQYRMNEQICQLSNEIVYGGSLKCANSKVRNRQLQLVGFPENVPVLSSQIPQSWLTNVLNPNRRVVFLNTDQMHTFGEGGHAISPLERVTGRGSGGGVINETEVFLVRKIIHGLLSCGLEATKIGVICPFRAQVSTGISSRSSHKFLTLSRLNVAAALG